MKSKVLVVEDELDHAELIEYNLERQGYEVYKASNGVEALCQARRVLPDLILLDLMLPDIDGASIFDILRVQPSTADIPVIIVSALDCLVPRDRKIDSVEARFFRKPVDFNALGDCIRGTVEQQQRRLRVRVRQEESESEP